MTHIQIAAAISCTACWLLILFGPFHSKAFLLAVVVTLFGLAVWLPGEFRRGVRAADSSEDSDLPLDERRSRAMIILADWRGCSPAEVQYAVDRVPESEISTAGPLEIACRAVGHLEKAG